MKTWETYHVDFFGDVAFTVNTGEVRATFAVLGAIFLKKYRSVFPSDYTNNHSDLLVFTEYSWRVLIYHSHIYELHYAEFPL